MSTVSNVPSNLRLHRQQVLIFLALAFASTVSVAMVFARIVYTSRLTYVFMIWNLLLAWIPFGFAFLADRAYGRKGRPGFLTVLYAFFWLIFLPNAPYMITDLVYIDVLDRAPLWFNLVLLLSFAFNGLFLGLISLQWMQELVSKVLGRVGGWIFALAVLGLSGFGMYLGRFQRWNSWDVFTNPGQLVADVLDPLIHPITHRSSLAVSFSFSAMLTCIYLILVALARMPREPGVRSEA